LSDFAIVGKPMHNTAYIKKSAVQIAAATSNHKNKAASNTEYTYSMTVSQRGSPLHLVSQLCQARERAYVSTCTLAQCVLPAVALVLLLLTAAAAAVVV
jgi:hypothetical protein